MSRSDWLLKVGTRFACVIAASILLMIVGFLFHEATPALHRLGLRRFYTDAGWHPLSGQFGMMPMVVATLVTSLGAVSVAAPLGIGAAIFGRYYAPPQLAVVNRRILELLAGLPSVVFGLWGLTVLAPIVARFGGSGQNLLTATVVLSLMVLPTIALLADSALASAPREWIHGAAALGMTRAAILGRVVLPGVRRGLGVAITLALTRAFGETMAVLMLAGNVIEMPSSLLAPGRTLNANIALELGYASSDHRAVLFVSGLMLMLLVGIIVVAVSGTKSHDE